MLRVGAVASVLASTVLLALLSASSGFLARVSFHSSSGIQPKSYQGRAAARDTTAVSCTQGVQPVTMGMEQIKVIKNPTEEQIQTLGARSWPTWGCGVSKFPWTYEGTETCLILEGDVTVTPDDDREPVTVGVGDICVFPDGMSCTWDVRAAIKKHYKFE